MKELIEAAVVWLGIISAIWFGTWIHDAVRSAA